MMRRLLAYAGDVFVAPRMNLTTSGHCVGTGHRPLYRLDLDAARLHFWNRGQQAACIGVLGTVKNVLHCTVFYFLAQVHDHHTVRQLRNDAQIRLDVAQQFQHLRLNRHVHSRCRLVRDQQLGLARERQRHHGALAHPTAEIERVLIDVAARIGHADPSQHLYGLVVRLFFGHLLMNANRLNDLTADGMHRTERGHRLLKDHGNLFAANVSEYAAVGIFRGQFDNPIAIAEKDLPSHDFAILGKNPQDRLAGHARAAAALPGNVGAYKVARRRLDVYEADDTDQYRHRYHRQESSKNE